MPSPTCPYLASSIGVAVNNQFWCDSAQLTVLIWNLLPCISSWFHKNTCAKTRDYSDPS